MTPNNEVENLLTTTRTDVGDDSGRAAAGRGSAVGAIESIGAILLMLVTGSAAWGQAKLSSDLAGVSGNADVIIRYSTPPGQSDINAVITAGGVLKRQFSSIPAASFTMPSSALNGLANNPKIVYISSDRTLKGTLEFAEPTVNANIAFSSGFDGTDVGVAVIDSGVTPTPI